MTSSYEALSLKAAYAVRQQLQEKPDSCFGLPTGQTPLGLYKILADWSAEGQLDWSQTTCFALDDYLDAEESLSFAHYLVSNLYQFTNLPRHACFNPRFCDNYDSLIAEKGGLDLTIVGIGRNGHLAFCEPGTPALSWTHCLYLTESTRQANASFFGSLEHVPHKAVTMGLSTILGSRKLILIASGQHKQSILHKSLTGPITCSVPASFLQKHGNVHIFTDFTFT